MKTKKTNLSADELAKKGKLARSDKKKTKSAAKKKAAKNGRDFLRRDDQKRVFLHITKWHGSKDVFGWLAILFFVCIIPFVSFTHIFDSFTFTHYLFTVIPAALIVVFALLYFTAKAMVPKKAVAEKKWIDNLPFKLIAYPDVLVYRSYPTLYFTLKFKRKAPELSYLLDVFATLPYEIRSEVEFESGSDESDLLLSIPPPVSFIEEAEDIEIESIPTDAVNVIYKFAMNNKNASKFHRHRRWAVNWIHDACEVQFKAIHEKFPLESVTLNDGEIELDFEWWIPIK